MIIERSMSDPWLSNTYVVADELGGSAVMVDAGGPVAPLLEYLNRGQFDLTHVLLTHHHHDHVADLEAVLRAYPGIPVLIQMVKTTQNAEVRKQAMNTLQNSRDPRAVAYFEEVLKH